MGGLEVSVRGDGGGWFEGGCEGVVWRGMEVGVSGEEWRWVVRRWVLSLSGLPELTFSCVLHSPGWRGEQEE